MCDCCSPHNAEMASESLGQATQTTASYIWQSNKLSSATAILARLACCTFFGLFPGCQCMWLCYWPVKPWFMSKKFGSHLIHTVTHLIFASFVSFPGSCWSWSGGGRDWPSWKQIPQGVKSIRHASGNDFSGSFRSLTRYDCLAIPVFLVCDCVMRSCHGCSNISVWHSHYHVTIQ